MTDDDATTPAPPSKRNGGRPPGERRPRGENPRDIILATVIDQLASDVAKCHSFSRLSDFTLLENALADTILNVLRIVAITSPKPKLAEAMSAKLEIYR